MSYKQIISKLIKKAALSNDEAEELMSATMKQELTDVQASALLVALQSKGITADELSSFVRVLRRFAVEIRPDVDDLIDTCGTGGDKSNTFNISTAAAFVLAGCSLNVAKHGNKSVSSKCGSADVLEALGINIHLRPEKVKECIEKTGIGFMFAPYYHPAFRHIGHIRKELGISTVFNVLGPLLNPASVRAQVIGVYDESLTELMAETLKKLGTRNAMVVNGDGLDEISCNRTKITRLEDGKIKSFYLDADELGMGRCSIDDFKGGYAEENAKTIIDILKGARSAKRDIVLLNSAAGLIVANKAKDFRDAIEIAADAIDSGRAMKKLEELKEFTNDAKENN